MGKIETKPCAHCGTLIIRADNQNQFNWKIKKYCSSLCKCSAATEIRRPKRIKINDHVLREALLDGLQTRKLQYFLTKDWR